MIHNYKRMSGLFGNKHTKSAPLLPVPMHTYVPMHYTYLHIATTLPCSIGSDAATLFTAAQPTAVNITAT